MRTSTAERRARARVRAALPRLRRPGGKARRQGFHGRGRGLASKRRKSSAPTLESLETAKESLGRDQLDVAERAPTIIQRPQGKTGAVIMFRRQLQFLGDDGSLIC